MTVQCAQPQTQTVDRRFSASHLNWFSSSERSLLNNSFGFQKTSTMSTSFIFHWILFVACWHFTSYCFHSRPSTIIILHTQLTLYCYGHSLGRNVPHKIRSREQMFREQMVQGRNVLRKIRSRERMVQGTNSPRNECSRDHSFPGTNVWGNEWSRERKFHHGNECSREWIVLRTNVPDTIRHILFEPKLI